jgi:hypothetical protein
MGCWSRCGERLLAAEYAHRFAGAYDLAWWIGSKQAGADRSPGRRPWYRAGLRRSRSGLVVVVRAAVLAELRERGG